MLTNSSELGFRIAGIDDELVDWIPWKLIVENRPVSFAVEIITHLSCNVISEQISFTGA